MKEAKMFLPDAALRVGGSGRHFQDVHGRNLLLRGVNVAASAKTPRGQPLWKLEGFWEQAEGDLPMSFVGRTFDLETADADIHLARLKSWGFNCLRYVFTWEAIEHAGPGQYDEDFIQYTLQMLKKCHEYGFKVYMDPHQDLFSRFSGGDGAPYWTLLAAGFDPRGFTATIAAHLQCEWPNAAAPDPRAFPDMIWATGYQKLAVQTLNTLFWAGSHFAPKCIIDGVNIQDYLQSHYINAVQHLAAAIAQFEDGSLLDVCVIGWDSMNEPNPGYLTTEDLGVHSKESVLRKGPMPTSFQAMQLGMGQACAVENWIFTSTGPKKSGDVTIDPQGTTAWLSAAKEKWASEKFGWKRDPGWTVGLDIWALHGVWDPSTRTLLRPDYFETRSGTTGAIEFGLDYWRPHWKSYARAIRRYHPTAVLFVHTPVFQVPPPLADTEELGARVAYSTHFYDGVTLVTKHWNWFNFDAVGFLRGKYRFKWQAVKVGEKAIRKCMREQLAVLKQDGQECIGDYPVMMGEIGVPFDLDDRQAYKTGDYSKQLRALDASLNACDGSNALDMTMWTYAPDNSHLDGDQWNGEDLSIWGVDDRSRRSSFNMFVTEPKPPARPYSSASSPTDLPTSPSTSAVDLNIPPSTPLLADTAGPYKDMDLNDGARALPAFCRPYPMATVGSIKEFEFDMRSSVFTLEVEVSSKDDVDPAQGTAIYVPLVHYAAKPGSGATKDALSPRPSTHDVFPTQTSASVSACHWRFRQPTQHIDQLALEVDVSAGKWEVEGQVLKWYYNKPLGGTAVQRISIRRAGGAIPAWREGYGHSSYWSAALGNVWTSLSMCVPSSCIVS